MQFEDASRPAVFRVDLLPPGAPVKRTASPDSPMFESMHRFSLHNFTVRVWREESDRQSFYPWDDLGPASINADGLDDRAEVSVLFEKCDRVTAVEVLDHHGNGSVVYTVWP
jgi:hypothetical protein